jgi:tight adherence protein B
LALLAGRADRAARAALPGVLDHVVAQLRAGGTVPDALRALAQRDGPLRHDFRRVTARLDLGATVEESLHGWAEERPVAGVRAAAGALTMVLALGGAAASPLEGLAVSLRNDETAAGEARALSAQARVSAVVVGLAPLVYLAFSTMTDPASARVLVDSFLGRVCLVTGLGLEVLAVVWMRALVKEPE